MTYLTLIVSLVPTGIRGTAWVIVGTSGQGVQMHQVLEVRDLSILKMSRQNVLLH